MGLVCVSKCTTVFVFFIVLRNIYAYIYIYIYVRRRLFEAYEGEAYSNYVMHHDLYNFTSSLMFSIAWLLRYISSRGCGTPFPTFLVDYFIEYQRVSVIIELAMTDLSGSSAAFITNL